MASEYAMRPPRVSVAYELDRARAGNKLFCPLFHISPGMLDSTVLPFEHAARLLKLLISNGLDYSRDHNASIVMIAQVLEASGTRYVTRAHVAEYLLYRLQGIRRASCRADTELYDAIANFYASWLPTRSIRTPS